MIETLADLKSPPTASEIRARYGEIRAQHAEMVRAATTGTDTRHECCAINWQAPR